MNSKQRRKRLLEEIKQRAFDSCRELGIGITLTLMVDDWEDLIQYAVENDLTLDAAASDFVVKAIVNDRQDVKINVSGFTGN